MPVLRASVYQPVFTSPCLPASVYPQPVFTINRGLAMTMKGLTIALGVIVTLAVIKLTHVGEVRGAQAASAGSARARYYRRRRPLEVTIYGRRRRGGYSFGVPEVIGTYGRAPPPYADVRQTPSGPFDSGFFFDSGIAPHGGNSPYLQ